MTVLSPVVFCLKCLLEFEALRTLLLWAMEWTKKVAAAGNTVFKTKLAFSFCNISADFRLLQRKSADS